MATLLPAVCGPSCSEAETATATVTGTGTWAALRSFGHDRGNRYLDGHLSGPVCQYPSVVPGLRSGGDPCCSRETRPTNMRHAALVASYSDRAVLRREIVHVYCDSLKLVVLAGRGRSFLVWGTCSPRWDGDAKMRTKLETGFGLSGGERGGRGEKGRFDTPGREPRRFEHWWPRCFSVYERSEGAG